MPSFCSISAQALASTAYEPAKGSAVAVTPLS